jgi:hypothetical protein
MFALTALLALGLAPRGRTVPVNDPGPFWPLVVGHQSAAYRDALPRGATYRLRSGRLPQGITLAASGQVTGAPAETGVFEAVYEAREASGVTYPLRVSLTVRDAEERDLVAAPRLFASAGPHATRSDELRVDVTSAFGQEPLRTRVRVVRPVGLGRPAPLLLFHRGRGFDHDDYRALHERIASHGVAVASIEDRLSFSGETFEADSDEYDLDRAELGMESASGVVEAVADHLLARSSDSSDALGGAFDPDGLFLAGHSRGGGATHASHSRSLALRLRGVIYLMAFDLRYFSEVAPAAPVAPAYPIADALARTPSLIIAAENDGDLTFPIADQLIDRAAGPTTQVTLYGAVHNLISDDHGAEGEAMISREDETTRTADWIVCFVKRWTERDARLDARLYGAAHQTSPAYAVASWMPSARTLVVEDAQDADPDRNRLGRNSVSGLRRQEASIYPDLGDFARLRLRHELLTPTTTRSAFRMASDRNLDTRAHRRVVLRALQTGTRGSSGWEVWLRLVDVAGTMGYARVNDPTAAGNLLPAWDGRAPQDRFIDIHVPLARVVATGATPLDRSKINAVDLVLVKRDATAARSVVLDAVRFE